jgi:LysM repeat protein
VSLPRRRPETNRVDSPARPARLAAGLIASVAAATTVALLPAVVPADAAAVRAAPVHGRAQGTPWPGHPDRALVRHVVRAGDTATGLAVRYHAWTDELLRLNHLGAGSTLHRGRVLRIPVVLSDVRRAGRQTPKAGKPAEKRHRHKSHQRKRVRTLIHSETPPTRRWRHDAMSRTQVRWLVLAMARHYDVHPGSHSPLRGRSPAGSSAGSPARAPSA